MLPDETSQPLLDARRALRRELRTKRRAIPPGVRAAAAERVAALVRHHFPVHPGQRIGLYCPLRDELDIAPLARIVARHGGRIFVPRLTDRRRCRMRFMEATGPMRPNHLGILEPSGARWVSARSLDLVFVPLVGFDATGMRLGMGAGYYDRAFAYLRLRAAWRRPKLIGVAFALQRVPRLTRARHDVPLDAVITEEGVIRCRTGC